MISFLAAMDLDIWGRPSKSDPYLRVDLGNATFNDRVHAVNDVTEMDLYKLVEFDAELPGTSQLSIQVYDKDDFNADELIGRTVIDLEDRWFDYRWQVRLRLCGWDMGNELGMRFSTIV